MLVAFPFTKRDQALALANLQWMAELGNLERHNILLAVDEGVDPSLELEVAKSCFRSAEILWIDPPTTTKWPLSQNHVWKRIVDYIDYKKLFPFFLCESDAIPTDPQWLNRLADEFSACGKPFSGYLEYAGDPERNHMNGVGGYGDIYKYAPSLLLAPTDDNGANYLAFDWAGGKEVVPQMHVTRLIQFAYKKEAELLKDKTLSWLNPDAVIFHTCKDVALIPLLRHRIFNTPPGNKATPFAPKKPEAILPQFEKQKWAHGLGEVRGPTSFVKSGALTCDIFIKTYDKVADWHQFAMRSIDRFCTGFRKVVTIGQQPIENYQAMQVHKLNADLHTDADYILTTDSDTLFCQPVTPETYMREGKTIWLHRTWEDAIREEGDAVKRWHSGMTKFFGREPELEFMCRHPELLPRWLYSAFRIFCYERHGKTMEEWVTDDREFADWNMLGYYAWLYHREAFFWINQSEVKPPPLTVKQYWGGHTPIEPHIPEMEAIIAGGVEVQHVPPGPVLRSLPLRQIFPATGRTILPVKKPRPKKRAKKKRTPEQQSAINARMAKARAGRKAVAA